jgi:hypothetical protein
VAAGGRYVTDAERLGRFRDAVAAGRSGNKLAAIVEALRANEYELSGPDLKRVPSPPAGPPPHCFGTSG